MFRNKRLAKGAAGSDRGTTSRFLGQRGTGRWTAGGRVGKPNVTKNIAERKLQSLKLRLADRGIPFDPLFQKKKNVKAQNQTTKAGNPSAASEAEKKTEELPSYRQKMSVTPDPERKCVDNEIQQIQEALLDALEPLEDGFYPQFYGSYAVKGALVMSCANEQTKQWLEKTVPKLVPWEGGKLCVKPKGEIAQGIKVILKTPKLFAKTDPKKILQMLGTQNKTLQTNTWKHVSAKTEESGQTLVYTVDSQSVQDIRALDNKVYLGLGNVELVISKDGEEEDKQAS